MRHFQRSMVCIWGVIVAAPLCAQQLRPLQIDDLFTIESYQGQAISPDGEWIAVVIQRARTEREVHNRPFLGGGDKSDVWLISRRDGKRRNLTNGLADASGYWRPVWSPDGARLAMMSTKGDTRGGDNVRLWVWERVTNRLVRVSSRPLDLQGQVEGADGLAPTAAGAGPFAWTAPTTLLFTGLPDSMASTRYEVEIRTQRIASRRWPEAGLGRVATVNVLDTGIPADSLPPPPRDGVLVRAELGGREGPREQVITSLDVANGVRRVLIHPRGSHALLVEGVEPPRPHPDTLLSLGARRGHTRIGVVALEPAGVPWWIDSLQVAVESGAWSPDGSRIAAVGRRRGVTSGDANLYVVAPATGAVVIRTASGINLSRAVWLDGQRLLLHGTRREGSDQPEAGWYLTAGDGAAPRHLTAGLRQVGSALMRLGEQPVILADGELHALTEGGAPQLLTGALQPRINAVTWPSAGRPLPVPSAVVEVGEPGARRLLQVTIAAGAAITTPLVKPQDKSQLLSFLLERGLALFGTSGEPFNLTSDGPRVWVVDLPAAGGSAGPAREVLALNQHLAGIVEPERRFIVYRGLDGDTLIADVLMPVGYRPGQRYPLVVHVYAGLVTRDSVEPRLRYGKNNPSSLNMQLLAARGYILMTPSMPLAPDGIAKDPYMELTKGVLPAVDRLVELGIADPARIGVMGQSFGGFSTYGLVTLTNRFKAAVSLAGISNWTSLYGAFDARDRYVDDPQDFFAPGLLETGQVSLGATMWRDPAKYIRNSPLFFFDRVTTPVMIIQGDVDYITMAQGEESFTALQRLGKRARFVRYWGEGHVLDSPANIRDMWQRVFEWFDHYLAPARAPAATP